MASSSSSSSCNQDEYQKQESRDEYELKKDDQFERLPDDLVMLIINKLIHMKTLIRFSLVSKRFFSLVPQTDSLFVDLDMDYRDRRQRFLGLVGGLLSNLVAKFTRASNMVNSNRQKYYARFHRFQQVKHLHLHHGINFASFKPLTRWVTVFGSHLEFCLPPPHSLFCRSIQFQCRCFDLLLVVLVAPIICLLWIVNM